MQTLTPFIWFEGNAEEAMNFYVEIFEDSKIIDIERYAGDQGIPGENTLKGKVLTGTFQVAGQRLMCIDGGPQFKPSAAISLMVEFEDQAELDNAWERLLDGGVPMQCGWITDRFGVTWQITPASLDRMMRNEHATPEQKKALMAAMMPMVKLDGPALEKAFKEAAL